MRLLILLGLLAAGLLCEAQGVALRLEGEVVDHETGQPVPSRLYVQDAAGKWHHVKSASPGGTAVPYAKERDGVVEIHTTLSAHPFTAELPAGDYRLTAERGKEYLPAEANVTLRGNSARVTLRLRRWINMAERGWYSGDTHVHRTLAELPNVALAEDLNASFPLPYWVTQAFKPPAQGDKTEARNLKAEPIRLDARHLIWPVNTEYELFTVNEKRHTLGAFFVIGHRTPFENGTPPVVPIAEEAHRQGALLELDKHNWPWSMAIIPVMEVDLYELSNNHIWRAGFAFRDFGEAPAEYMKIERNEHGLTEWGWINFGFENYYALLNCGFRLRPTAGTANGVHPVPLGFGRVYVKIDGEFSIASWLQALNKGRSFVTTGPMLFTDIKGERSGEVAVDATVLSESPSVRVELIVNGQVHETFHPETTKSGGPHEFRVRNKLLLTTTSWVAVRAFESRPGNRVRFAHSSPVFIDMPGKPLRPRKAEVDYLVDRVRQEIGRSRSLLPPQALAEYQKALELYRNAASAAN